MSSRFIISGVCFTEVDPTSESTDVFCSSWPTSTVTRAALAAPCTGCSWRVFSTTSSSCTAPTAGRASSSTPGWRTSRSRRTSATVTTWWWSWRIRCLKSCATGASTPTWSTSASASCSTGRTTGTTRSCARPAGTTATSCTESITYTRRCDSATRRCWRRRSTSTRKTVVAACFTTAASGSASRTTSSGSYDSAGASSMTSTSRSKYWKWTGSQRVSILSIRSSLITPCIDRPTLRRRCIPQCWSFRRCQPKNSSRSVACFHNNVRFTSSWRILGYQWWRVVK